MGNRNPFRIDLQISYWGSKLKPLSVGSLTKFGIVTDILSLKTGVPVRRAKQRTPIIFFEPVLLFSFFWKKGVFW
jgi:hypothetical protein